nr:MAG: MC086R [Molluscum contagiosum virus]
MAWSVSGACGSGFQTLEDLREQLRCEAEDAPADEEPVLSALELPGCGMPGSPKRQRRTRKEKDAPSAPRLRGAGAPPLPEKKGARARKPRVAEAECTPDSDEDCHCEAPCEPCELSAKDEQQPGASPCALEQDSLETTEDDAACLSESELALAAANIQKDLRKLTVRVTALTTVLTDAQAATTSRSFCSLVRAVEKLQLTAYGGARQVARKPRTKRAGRV